MQWYFLLLVSHYDKCNTVKDTTTEQHITTQANFREICEEKKKQQKLWLKTISIHSYSQLSELQGEFSNKEPVILIARITPIVTKNIEEGMKLVNELYSVATKKNYSVFRLGEERIIVVPPNVQVKGTLYQNGLS